MSVAAIRVLMVEDDLNYVDIVRICLKEPESMGLAFELEPAVCLSEGLLKLTTSRYDAALVDLTLADASGLEAVVAVLSAAPDMPTLVSTNFGDEATALEAVRLGAQDFMIKATTDSRMLKRSIRYAIERKAVLAQRDQIIRAAVDGMIVVDSSGTVQFVNVAAERILGAAGGELVGRTFPYAARVGETTLLEIQRPNAPPALVEMRVTEVPWTSGPASLAGLRDVTELRRIERWKSEVAERRKLDELKDRWIETVSHELRSPLSTLKMAIVTIDKDLSKTLPPEQAGTVDVARRQLERIERMIVNLLDLSRMESGRVRADRVPLDAVAVLRRVTGDFERTASERGIRLETDFEAESAAAFADPDLFEQLAVNLVDNAIRFARARVAVRSRGGSGGRFEVSVQDDGEGITPEKKELLFTRFSQLERKPGSDGYKGTGLGLAICKEIVGLHRGRIEVESEPGRGTTFLVALPPDGTTTLTPA